MKKENIVESPEELDRCVEIGARHTSEIGKPALIFNSEYGKLSKNQKLLLSSFDSNGIARFDRYGDNITVKMLDLSCLTAYTGKEYSLFSRNDRQFLVVGTERGIHISKELSDTLIKRGYKWTGHTHVGDTEYCLMPSDADYETLRKFHQKRSVIFNSVGKFYVFGEEE